MSIQEMYLDNLSVSEIVRRTGHKRHVVDSELRRLGVARRTKSEVAEVSHLQLKYNKIYEAQECLHN